jgi:hypothetical protein
MLGALKARIPAGGRAWMRAALRGNPYRIEPGDRPIRIGELVSPLRYDVLLRKRHFEFLREHRDLFAEDFDAYEKRARQEPYFVWFERVMAPSWLPEVMDDQGAFETAWRERLRRSFELLTSFEKSGFDPAYPVELLAGNSVAPTATGKRLARSVFAGDGNHRLALLMAAGVDELTGAQYRIKRYRSLVPADTTGLLFEWTGGGWTEYQDFIALGYPTVSLRLVEGRVEVADADAATTAEVEAIVSADLPHLADLPHA